MSNYESMTKAHPNHLLWSGKIIEDVPVTPGGRLGRCGDCDDVEVCKARNDYMVTLSAIIALKYSGEPLLRYHYISCDGTGWELTVVENNTNGGVALAGSDIRLTPGGRAFYCEPSLPTSPAERGEEVANG
jgi:hypothetical protein